MAWRSWCVLLLCAALPSAGLMAADLRAARLQPASPMAGPDMLGTLAVPIRAERFDDSLKRAREDASRSPALQRMVSAARPLAPLQQLLFVQQAVSARIHWISDTTEWGQHDYWASAAQTMSRGAGDMEDRAIVKLQALRALGFSNSDLFLTLARDRVGGPLTVLTVRSGGHYYVLDDSGAAPFDAEQRRFELEPVLSFGLYGAWVHVRPPAIASAGSRATALARK
jgi:predicted transglutaminase-like cysteine proteinase